jgi:hypothetical protein
MKEAIEKIESMANEAQGLKVEGPDGILFTTQSLSPIIFDPHPETLGLSTLSGFADYVNANRDGIDLSKAVAHVDGHRLVSLCTEAHGLKKKRDIWIAAEYHAEKEFPFGQFLPVEDFIIRTRSMIQQTDDRDALIKFVSKVTGTTEITQADDGAGQLVSVKRSATGALDDGAPAPAIVSLKPYRTFLEIDQPESEFLVRIKQGDDGLKVALFEVDGGRWKFDAVERIVEFLKDNIEEKDLAIIR